MIFAVRKRNAVQAKFDREFNVDTTGLISLGDLDVECSTWVHGTQYGPTSPATFEVIMSALPIDVSDYTFVDFGSGKGAVLLYASAFPFKQILGVEFSSIFASDCRIQYCEASACQYAAGTVNTQRCDAIRDSKRTAVCFLQQSFFHPDYGNGIG